MKKRILSAVLVKWSNPLSAAASVHAEDYDSQIAAADITQLVTLFLNKRLHKRKLLQSNLKHLHFRTQNQN